MKKNEVSILIVEDDVALRGAISSAIKKFGFRPVAVVKADEALNLVKIRPIHAAIIDCMLPKINGIELATEFRKTRFNNSPIILMSGIFRDKAFASESIKKVNALEFLSKPFDLKVLKDLLENALHELYESQQIPLQALISKPFASNRDRIKAIEGLEEVVGFDLPFIISVLMESSATGHLNIVNTAGEIFGVTFGDGKITAVDSSESTAMLAITLLQKGYITQKDLDEIGGRAGKGDLLELLLNDGFISPHTIPIIRTEQITQVLSQLISPDKVSINFVKGDVKDTGVAVQAKDLTPFFHDSIEQVVSLEYLQNFYKTWREHPIRLGNSFSRDHQLFQMKIYEGLQNLAEQIEAGQSIDEMLAEKKWTEVKLLKALHLLALRRLIVFDDIKKVKGAEDLSARIEHTLKNLSGKNPVEIFEYFGAGKNAKSSDVEKIFNEFAKSNHPDLLPANASAELKVAANKVFALVNEAYSILSDDKKREKYFAAQKAKDGEQQIRAEHLNDEGITLLRRGKAKEALKKLQEAYACYASRKILVNCLWAELKSLTGQIPKSKLDDVSQKLESIPNEERRNVTYLLTISLLKKAQGDVASAKALLEKAMTMDADSLDVRREINALAGETAPKNEDLLTGDLTTIVGNMFKKKTR